MGMTTVDENEAQRRGPCAGGEFGPADDGDHGVLQPRAGQGVLKKPERVDPSRGGIEEHRVEVLFPGLLFLRAPVVVDRKKHLAALAAGRADTNRRLPAVAPDFQAGPEVRGFKGYPVQVQTLVVGEKALGGPDEIEVRRHKKALGSRVKAQG